MTILALFVVALAILAFGAVSGRLERSPITPPMIFVLLGLGLSPLFLGHEGFSSESGWIHVLAELTLVLVLFTDASRIDLRLLRKEHDLPVRLLGLGMPLTILAGLGLGLLLFPGSGIWAVAVLAAILAPTDAALGQAVVTSPLVPVRIRQTLNVESGLNDGIALPFVLLFVCAGEVAHTIEAGFWLRFVLLQITLGPLIGSATGYLGGILVTRSTRAGWMNQSFQELSAIGLAVLAFAGAELAGGNGFIAAFVAGLTLGNTARGICTCLYEFAEAEGQLLTLLVFLVFGSILVPEAWPHLGVTTWVYAAGSLTIVRLLPAAIALTGARLRWETLLFLGWFGPRGIASILFALLVLEESELPGKEMILAVVTATVLLSVFAHGLTANPASRWYASRLGRADPDMPEHTPVKEMPVRIPR